jgi:DNA polymerase-4
MRQIACCKISHNVPRQPFLQACAALTPLVEPQEEVVYLDLSGCGPARELLRGLAARVQELPLSPLRIGLATNKLIARLAVDSPSRLPKHIGRHENHPRYTGVEIFPGKEAEFVAALPLPAFPHLDQRLMKKLSRLGFTRVGEVAALTPAQLHRILGNVSPLLYQQLQGNDPTPVLGLYPPERLTCLVAVEGVVDQVKMKALLQDLAALLSKQLASRHACCRLINLELTHPAGKSQDSRELAGGCSSPERLVHILESLLARIWKENPVNTVQVSLEKLSPREWQEPDLFLLPENSRQKTKDRRKQALDSLYDRFPDLLVQGPSTDRREQLLALWDPWRFPGRPLHE